MHPWLLDQLLMSGGSPRKRTAAYLKGLSGTYGLYKPNEASGVSVSGGFVAQINDLSGLGLDLVQGTGANRAADNTNPIGGQRVASFDGVNDHYTAPTFDLGSGPSAFVIVYRQRSMANTAQDPFGYKGASTIGVLANISNPSYRKITVNLGYSGSLNTLGHDSDPLGVHLHIVNYDGVNPNATSSYAITYDGAAQTVTGGGVGDNGSGWNAGLTLGSRPSYLFHANMDFALLHFLKGRKYTSGELSTITRLVKAEYGIT